MINAENYSDVKDILKTDTAGMTVEEQINYASSIIGMLPYNDDRAAFIQSANTESQTLMDQL